MQICAKTIVAALWDSEVLHSGLPAEPDALKMEWIMDLNVDQPLNGDMTKASMVAQELLCPQHCLWNGFLAQFLEPRSMHQQ